MSFSRKILAVEDPRIGGCLLDSGKLFSLGNIPSSVSIFTDFHFLAPTDLPKKEGLSGMGHLQRDSLLLPVVGLLCGVSGGKIL